MNKEAVFQPPPVMGYRALPESTVELMNEIKEHGRKTQELIDKVTSHMKDQATRAYNEGDTAEEKRIRAAEPNRWAAIAKTDLQQGLMALTRAVAQPSGF